MYKTVDKLGRIFIPKEIREMFHIKSHDLVEISLEGHQIHIKRHKASEECMLTGKISEDNYSFLDGKIILSKSAAEEIIEYLEKIKYSSIT